MIRISHWRVGSSKESCLFFCANFPIGTSNLSSGFSLLNTCIDILELSVRDNHLQVIVEALDLPMVVFDTPKGCVGVWKTIVLVQREQARLRIDKINLHDIKREI